MPGWTKESLSDFDLQRLMTRLLDTVEIFSGFTQSELADILAGAEKCVFQPRQTILTEGSTGHFMYIIIDGEVEISKKLAVGGNKVLTRLSAGNCFGEMALVDNNVRSATVKSVSKCIMLRLSENEFRKNPPAGAKLYRNVARLLSQRLRDTNAMISLAYLESSPSEYDPCPAFNPAITLTNATRR
jgi:CRP/FNR family transcriptional regulator, cyclic AMP receptor protein